jgi:uncharacterized cupredoxin-like copper-binding protein
MRSHGAGDDPKEVTMLVRSLALAPATVLALGALAAGGATAATRTTTVKVTAKDFSFALSRKSVPHGRVTFTIKNAGRAEHDFAIAGHSSKTIAAGKSTSLTVMLKPDRYPYRCSVDGHADLGMRGVLKVT